MKTQSIQQEILLITGSSFASRQWCERDENNQSKNWSDREKLEDACWNGLFRTMLPEIFGNAGSKFLALWQIREANSFLDLELGEYPQPIEKEHSVNPYIFIDQLNLN